MNDHRDDLPAFGWRELGRYFIVVGALAVPLSLIHTGLMPLLLPTLMDLRPNYGIVFIVQSTIQHLPPTLLLIAAILFALRGYANRWQMLGFTRTEPYWFVVALSGWLAIIGIFGYALSATGREMFGPDVLFGQPTHSFASPSTRAEMHTPVLLAIALIIANAAMAAASEVAHRGLVYQALRRYWQAWLSAIVASLVSTLVFYTAMQRLGVVPIFAMWFFGSILNCWLREYSRSLLPGLLGIVSASIYVAVAIGL